MDLGLCWQHMTEDKFSHGAAEMQYVKKDSIIVIVGILLFCRFLTIPGTRVK